MDRKLKGSVDGHSLYFSVFFKNKVIISHLSITLNNNSVKCFLERRRVKMFIRLRRKIRLKKVKRLLQDIKQDNMEYRDVISNTKILVTDYIDSTSNVLQQLQLANNSLKEVLIKNE